MEETNTIKQSKSKQPIKLMSNLRKISDLNLNEKTSILEGSVFHGLSKVNNKKENSSTLIASLCKHYDASKKLFVLNNETTFGFCSKEVATVLGLQDSGGDFSEYDKLCSKYPKKFAGYIFELRDSLCLTDKKEFMSTHLKDILRRMEVKDESSKVQFRQMMSYYIVEQFLLCSSNTKKPRTSFWRLVNDLESFESINWSKATLDHLLASVLETKQWLDKGGSGQHNFKGAAPVLETIAYERIPSIRPKVWSSIPPLIQKYGPQRNDVDKWTLDQLTPADIIPCPHCAVSSSSSNTVTDEDEAVGREDASCSLSKDAADEDEAVGREDAADEDEAVGWENATSSSLMVEDAACSLKELAVQDLSLVEKVAGTETLKVPPKSVSKGAAADDGIPLHDDDELVALAGSLTIQSSSSQVAKEKAPTKRTDIVGENEKKAPKKKAPNVAGAPAQRRSTRQRGKLTRLIVEN